MNSIPVSLLPCKPKQLKRQTSDPGPRRKKILTKNGLPVIGLSQRRLPNPKFGQILFHEEWDWDELIDSIYNVRLRDMGLFDRTDSPIEFVVEKIFYPLNSK